MVVNVVWRIKYGWVPESMEDDAPLAGGHVTEANDDTAKWLSRLRIIQHVPRR